MDCTSCSEPQPQGEEVDRSRTAPPAGQSTVPEEAPAAAPAEPADVPAEAPAAPEKPEAPTAGKSAPEKASAGSGAIVLGLFALIASIVLRGVAISEPRLFSGAGPSVIFVAGFFALGSFVWSISVLCRRSVCGLVGLLLTALSFSNIVYTVHMLVKTGVIRL